jgi:prepilin-type N-terminal cleavage/methylation domain-containing protein
MTMSKKLTEIGFTLTELLLVIAVLGILSVMLLPKATAVLTRAATGQAAGIVALDLERAVTLAGRERRPVRIACDCANGRYTITDRASGTVLVTRTLAGGNGQLNVQAIAFSATPVDVFPSGLTSGALTVTLTSSGVSRQVTMSAGGFVRLVR